MSLKSKQRRSAGRRETKTAFFAPIAERFPRFIGAPNDAAARLATLRAGVVSVGSVGARIAWHLARLQVAAITIVDPAYFKPQSVLTHEITPAQIGQLKAAWTAQQCRAICPATDVSGHIAKVQDLPLSIWADCDLLVAAPDNLPTERYVGEMAMNLGKPLVLAAVHGPSLTAQVRVFANQGAAGPCAACSYNDPEWEAHDESQVFSCAGGIAGGSAVAMDAYRTQPTMSTSFLCSLAADLAVNQILRHWLGLGSPVSDSLLSWSGYQHRPIVTPLRRNPRCRCDHRAWTCINAESPLPALSVERLVDLASDSGTSGTGSTVRIDGYLFAVQAPCCGRDWPIGRFVADGESVDAFCQECGARLEVPPFYMCREVRCEALPRHVALADLGVKRCSELFISAGEQVVFVRGKSLSTEAVS